MTLEIFRKYPTIEEAELLIVVLDRNKILYKIEDYTNQVNVAMLGQNIDLAIIIKTQVSDFPKIEELLDKEYTLTLGQVDEKHYLFDFSNEELTEIIMKPNEWSNYDYKVAELMLKDRGVVVSEEFIENIKKQRYNQLREKESFSSVWIIIGYVSAFLGGLFGFAIGIGLWKMKKKLPNGEKIYEYDENSRKHGKRITILGFIMAILYVSLKILYG